VYFYVNITHDAQAQCCAGTAYSGRLDPSASSPGPFQTNLSRAQSREILSSIPRDPSAKRLFVFMLLQRPFAAISAD
jgi:hypothetical protein